MLSNIKNIKRSLGKKAATVLLISASFAAFASLGDRGKKGTVLNSNLPFSSKNFSLRSGYNYRNNQLFSALPATRMSLSNTFISYQKGNATYILPLRKTIFSDKIKFGPAQPRF